MSSTTGDSRLNHHMMLHVHKDGTDAPTLVDVGNDFVGEKENQNQFVGTFSANDIPNKSSFRQSQHKRKITDKYKWYCRQM